MRTRISDLTTVCCSWYIVLVFCLRWLQGCNSWQQPWCHSKSQAAQYLLLYLLVLVVHFIHSTTLWPLSMERKGYRAADDHSAATCHNTGAWYTGFKGLHPPSRLPRCGGGGGGQQDFHGRRSDKVVFANWLWIRRLLPLLEGREHTQRSEGYSNPPRKKPLIIGIWHWVSQLMESGGSWGGWGKVGMGVQLWKCSLTFIFTWNFYDPDLR